MNYKMENLVYTREQRCEAIVQLRPYNQELIDFVKNQIAKKPGVFISKEVPLKEGIDFHITSHKIIRNLVTQLKKQFKGEVKLSKKLVTFDRAGGKRIHRVTLLFRLKE